MKLENGFQAHLKSKFQEGVSNILISEAILNVDACTPRQVQFSELMGRKSREADYFI